MTTPFKTEILDTTLREGEQCYGVFFPIEMKKRIAILLDAIGVDFIEVGHPAAAPSIRQAVSEITNLNLRARLIGHARLEKNEISLVSKLGLRWVGLFCGINERSRKKYGLSKQAIYSRAAAAVKHAGDLGLSIKFTCEDASRTEFNELIEFYEYLASLGVDRLSFADTVGIMGPENVEKLHSCINNRVPFSSLHFHFHNDSGFAWKSAVRVIQYGAQSMDTSILGIGERTGLVSLGSIFPLLRGDKAGLLREAERLVRSCINQEHYKNRRFAHKSGIHINGILKDPDNYEAAHPCGTGGERLLVLSKLIGSSGLQTILARHGFHYSEQDTASLLQQIKSDDTLELAGQEEINRYFTGMGLQRQGV
jgi:isopropylmalate/homocitrate/citramalate synthase